MLRRLYEKEEGNVSIIVAVYLVVFISLLALVVDVGMMYYGKSKFQSAVDSAALAAARELPDVNAATQRAREYVVKNGFSANDIAVTFEGGNTIVDVTGNKDLNTTFAQVFNVDKVPVTVFAGAKMQKGNYDYLMFSGSSTANIYLGGRFDIEGSIHSNGGFSASPSYGLINGNIEACKTIYVNTYTTTVNGTKTQYAPFIPMMDFSGVVSSVMPTTYTNNYTATYINGISSKQTFNNNTKITGGNVVIQNQAVINGNLYIDGDLTIKGGAPACELYGNLYVKGNLSFDNTFKGNGCVLAYGNITFNGGSATFTSGKTISIFSENGNVNVSTSQSEIHGAICAPKGSVNIQGGKTTFYGSIIANQITGIPSDLTLKPPDMETPLNVGTSTSKLVK